MEVLVQTGLALCVACYLRVAIRLLTLFPIGYYIIGTIVLALTIAFTVFHKQIVKWLQPAANWMHEYVLRFSTCTAPESPCCLHHPTCAVS